MKNYRIIYKVLPLLFLLLLVFPYINSKYTLFDPGESFEKRTLAEEPELSIETYFDYPSLYDSYFNDNFNLRNWYIKWHSYINFMFFNKSSYPESVIVGTNGWLFWNKGEFPTDWEKNLYTAAELDSISRFIQRRTDFYEQKGIDYYLVIIPNKQCVYPEFLPPWLQIDSVGTKQNRMDQLVGFLSEHKQLDNVFYMRNEMIRHKKDGLVYRKIDHHWSDLGSYYVSAYLLEQVKKKHPTVMDALNQNNFSFYTETTDDGDLLFMLGLRGEKQEMLTKVKCTNPHLTLKEGYLRQYTPTPEFPYPEEFEKVMTTFNPELPKAVIIRDSYATHLLNQLSYGFDETIYIWDYWVYGLNEEIINNEKPEIVINLVSENNLENLLKNKL